MTQDVAAPVSTTSEQPKPSLHALCGQARNDDDERREPLPRPL